MKNIIGRVIIEGVQPEVDGGRFAIKRSVGEMVEVEADIFTDGHDIISAILLYRKETDTAWRGVFMKSLVNDRWRGSFRVEEVGRYFYTLQAWVDRFMTWRRDIKKKVDAGQEVAADLLIGSDLIQNAAMRADGADQAMLRSWAELLVSDKSMNEKIRLAMDANLGRIVTRFPDRSRATRYAKKLPVAVERQRARFSAWYEMFPRSCSGKDDQHGTFKDCEKRLPYIAEMGFDVLYLPPIHPIGITHRKGKNNALRAGPDDPGSPWAIGGPEGGHCALHPQLGTLEDFRRFVSRADEFGIEVALDLAFQCTPDHPYVQEHPEWFYRRPDGTIQYAENPPKKYEDIYPLNFENDRWQDLWQELRGVVYFWIDQGIRIFRVDNPHTKPFAFWKWLIAEVKNDHPETIFLAEAFTRPRVMYRLAKLGFTQSYTYFAWRNTKWELTQYFTELSRAPVREIFWPNLWPNTPDILTEYLQMGGRQAFATRLVLAATLGANYGIYGPAFELGENTAREAHSEEYLNSEKYQIRSWDIDRPDSRKSFIARVNRIRRENPALQKDRNLHFHPVDNEHLIAYSKHTGDLSNIILVVVNLDPHHTHTGWLEFSPETVGLDPQQSFQVHDLLSDARYLWQGVRNFVELNPQIVPAHIFVLRRKVRTERDFDYFL
ncbi:MAG: alpha-1,4-glucan--maltose-1-phosphate maltosyltransferase [Desulfobacterales bacterium]|nr:MAG: alpha-1,4-glucan--maltose-1-phosphate maltosyltransferase [Desulfobacterales bacterium]